MLLQAANEAVVPAADVVCLVNRLWGLVESKKRRTGQQLFNMLQIVLDPDNVWRAC